MRQARRRKLLDNNHVCDTHHGDAIVPRQSRLSHDKGTKRVTFASGPYLGTNLTADMERATVPVTKDPATASTSNRSTVAVDLPQCRTTYGQGNELDSFDDLPTEATKERQFSKEPKEPKHKAPVSSKVESQIPDSLDGRDLPSYESTFPDQSRLKEAIPNDSLPFQGMGPPARPPARMGHRPAPMQENPIFRKAVRVAHTADGSELKRPVVRPVNPDITRIAAQGPRTTFSSKHRDAEANQEVANPWLSADAVKATDTACRLRNHNVQYEPLGFPNKRGVSSEQRLKLGLAMAKIFVGAQKGPFLVHVNFLPRFLEPDELALAVRNTGGPMLVILENVNKDAFEVYIHWLYTGKMSTFPEQHIPSSSREERLQHYNLLIECCRLADGLKDSDFHNDSIDMLIAATTKDQALPLIPADLKVGSALQRLLVDLYVYADVARNFEDLRASAEFWEQVAKGLAERLEQPRSSSRVIPWANTCRYHKHDKVEDKKAS